MLIERVDLEVETRINSVMDNSLPAPYDEARRLQGLEIFMDVFELIDRWAGGPHRSEFLQIFYVTEDQREIRRQDPAPKVLIRWDDGQV